MTNRMLPILTTIKDYLTVKQAAEFLGIAPNTIRNWSNDKKIIYYRSPINNYRLYKKEDLEKFLESYAELLEADNGK